MRAITGPDDVKVGDRVTYAAHYYMKRGAKFAGVVVGVGVMKLSVRDVDGKRRSFVYTVKVTTGSWQTIHYNFSRLDAADIWRSERPESPLAARYDSAVRDPCIYSVSRVALLNDRDAVIAEIDAMRAWLLREPKVTP